MKYYYLSGLRFIIDDDPNPVRPIVTSKWGGTATRRRQIDNICCNNNIRFSYGQFSKCSRAYMCIIYFVVIIVFNFRMVSFPSVVARIRVLCFTCQYSCRRYFLAQKFSNQTSLLPPSSVQSSSILPLSIPNNNNNK